MIITDLTLLLIYIGKIIKQYVIINCLTETKEESPEHSCNWIISINAALLLFVIVIGTVCFAKYGKLKTVPCVRHVAEIDNQLIQHIKWCATNDTGQGESHEMMYPLKSGND